MFIFAIHSHMATGKRAAEQKDEHHCRRPGLSGPTDQGSSSHTAHTAKSACAQSERVHAMRTLSPCYGDKSSTKSEQRQQQQPRIKKRTNTHRVKFTSLAHASPLEMMNIDFPPPPPHHIRIGPSATAPELSTISVSYRAFGSASKRACASMREVGVCIVPCRASRHSRM